MSKLAIVFAGQGSQYLGMGLDFVHQNDKLSKMLEQASQILGYDVKMELTTDNGNIHLTKYTQPLMFLATIFAYEELLKLKPNVSGFAGFSLGEYSALYASSIFKFDDLLEIVKRRAALMDDETKKTNGKMAAILGLNSKQVDQICRDVKNGVVVSANYNSPIQTVISGEEQAVLEAIELAKALGAKRAIMLQVSGAFHSPLMEVAGKKLYDYLMNFKPEENKIPVYMNTTAKPLVFDQLKNEMKKQVYSPVYFEQIINQMVEDGFTHFIEVGPGSVLSGLIKKINLDLEVKNLSKVEDLESLKGWLEQNGLIK